MNRPTTKDTDSVLFSSETLQYFTGPSKGPTVHRQRSLVPLLTSHLPSLCMSKLKWLLGVHRNFTTLLYAPGFRLNPNFFLRLYYPTLPFQISGDPHRRVRSGPETPVCKEDPTDFGPGQFCHTGLCVSCFWISLLTPPPSRIETLVRPV